MKTHYNLQILTELKETPTISNIFTVIVLCAIIILRASILNNGPLGAFTERSGVESKS